MTDRSPVISCDSRSTRPAPNDAHAEVDGENPGPVTIEPSVDRVFAPQPQALQHGKVAGNADRDRREDDVERDREPESDPGEFQCRQSEHGRAPFSIPRVAIAATMVFEETDEGLHLHYRYGR
jgi:hypothetical protein